MSIQLDENEFRAHLNRIVAADTETARNRAADELIVELHYREVLEQWGRYLAGNFGRPNDWDEFTSVITEALLVHVRSLTPEDLTKVHTVGSYLFWRGKAAVQLWLDSPAVTFAAQMSGISRRHRMARAAVREMRKKLGREPDAAEVVEYVNTRALATRKNPVKQGALITVEDVEGAMLRTYSMDYTASDSEANDSFGATDDGGVTIAGEVALTVAQLDAQVDRMFIGDEASMVKETLELWVKLVLTREAVTSVTISRLLGISRRGASQRIRLVNDVMSAFRSASTDT
jgi:hypothetical protein